MNTEPHTQTDESIWNEVVFEAVKHAKEHIIALPDRFRPTAFDMLTASLIRELGQATSHALDWRNHSRAPRHAYRRR